MLRGGHVQWYGSESITAGYIQQVSYIPQPEQHLHCGLMLLCLGSATNISILLKKLHSLSGVEGKLHTYTLYMCFCDTKRVKLLTHEYSNYMYIYMYVLGCGQLKNIHNQLTSW